MTKRALLQLIERMPHEAEVEYLGDEANNVGPDNAWLKLRCVEFEDGKIRLS